MEERLQKKKGKLQKQLESGSGENEKPIRLVCRQDLTEEQQMNGEPTGDVIPADQPQPPTKKETFGDACQRMGKEMGALEFTPLQFKQKLEEELDQYVKAYHQIADITGEIQEKDGNLKGFLAVQLNVLAAMTKHLSSILNPPEEEKK